MGLFDKKLGVDLGTINTLIYENEQIVLQEPSLVALDRNVVCSPAEALECPPKARLTANADRVSTVAARRSRLPPGMRGPLIASVLSVAKQQRLSKEPVRPQPAARSGDGIHPVVVK